MPERTLSMRITARDDSSKVFKEVKSGVAGVDAAVIQGNQAVATSAVAAERSFTMMAADVKLAGRDFQAGKLSVTDYAHALEFARQEAVALRATGVVPVGVELKAMNAVMGTLASTTGRTVGGLGTVRSTLGGLSAVAVGLPGQFGSLVGALGMMSIGSLTTAGIFLGILGLAAAFKSLGASEKEAKERLDELLKADPLGRLAAIGTAMSQGERRALREAARAELAGAPGQIVGMQGETLVGMVNPRIAVLEKTIRDLDAVIKDVSTDLENDAGAAAKKAAEELARAAKEAGDAAKEAREAREDAMEDARAAQVDAREYFADQKKIRDEETALRLDANRQLRGTLFGIPGGSGVATERAARSLFGGGAPELTLGMGRPGGPGALAGARKTLTGDLGRIQNETFDAIAEGARSIELKMESTFDDVANAVKKGGVNMVSAMSLAANALAGLITGRQSPMGALGGITSGLSGLFSGAAAGTAMASLATPLGIAGIAFGFLDALTSSGAKEAATEAHLAALRKHDAERPAATIVLAIDGGFDPTNREHQRLLDRTRRESEASGYRVTVK